MWVFSHHLSLASGLQSALHNYLLNKWTCDQVLRSDSVVCTHHTSSSLLGLCETWDLHQLSGNYVHFTGLFWETKLPHADKGILLTTRNSTRAKLFLFLLIDYYSRTDVIKAKIGIKSIVPQKEDFFLLFYPLLPFSRSPLTIPLSEPALSKGFDTNHSHNVFKHWEYLHLKYDLWL